MVRRVFGLTPQFPNSWEILRASSHFTNLVQHIEYFRIFFSLFIQFFYVYWKIKIKFCALFFCAELVFAHFDSFISLSRFRCNKSCFFCILFLFSFSFVVVLCFVLAFLLFCQIGRRVILCSHNMYDAAFI